MSDISQARTEKRLGSSSIEVALINFPTFVTLGSLLILGSSPLRILA